MWSQVGLGSITTNKVSGGDGIPVELFQILKDDAVKVLYSIWKQIWKTQQWSQGWKRLAFIPIPKKSNAKEWSNYHTIALISHASQVRKVTVIIWADTWQFSVKHTWFVSTLNIDLIKNWKITTLGEQERENRGMTDQKSSIDNI